LAAIDLLFDTKKDSERLHQALLCGLLCRTRVLHHLLGLTDLEAVDFDWEPGRIPLEQAIYLRGSDGSRVRVFIEVRVDHSPSEARIDEQIARVLSEPRDRLVYLLLGYSRITTPRRDLLYRLASVPTPPDTPPVLGRIGVCDALELITLLADPDVLPRGDSQRRRDARDLCAAYRDALQDLEGRTRRFTERPVATWEIGDYLGFFDTCRRRPATKQLQEAGIGFIADHDSGFYACWWAYEAIGPSAWLYLQFEDDRLCIKIEVGDAAHSTQRALYEQARAILRTLPTPEGLASPVPAVFRAGRTLTVATFSGLLVDLAGRWHKLCQQLEQVEEMTAEIAKQLLANPPAA
jgi:hypothetical protein